VRPLLSPYVIRDQKGGSYREGSTIIQKEPEVNLLGNEVNHSLVATEQDRKFSTSWSRERGGVDRTWRETGGVRTRGLRN